MLDKAISFARMLNLVTEDLFGISL